MIKGIQFLGEIPPFVSMKCSRFLFVCLNKLIFPHQLYAIYMYLISSYYCLLNYECIHEKFGLFPISALTFISCSHLLSNYILGYTQINVMCMCMLRIYGKHILFCICNHNKTHIFYQVDISRKLHSLHLHETSFYFKQDNMYMPCIFPYTLQNSLFSRRLFGFSFVS